jgi:hypothetical protein
MHNAFCRCRRSPYLVFMFMFFWGSTYSDVAFYTGRFLSCKQAGIAAIRSDFH